MYVLNRSLITEIIMTAVMIENTGISCAKYRKWGSVLATDNANTVITENITNSVNLS